MCFEQQRLVLLKIWFFFQESPLDFDMWVTWWYNPVEQRVGRVDSGILERTTVYYNSARKKRYLPSTLPSLDSTVSLGAVRI